MYGNFKAIYKLKKEHRHLKVLLSIGGWTYSPSFHPIVVSPQLRSKFVASAVRLLEDHGLDGLDVDYEYPSNEAQARGYLDLLRELRAALDHHAQKKGADYKFLLTVCLSHVLSATMLPQCATHQIAAPCGPDNYKKLFIHEMDAFLDFWNLMAYDFGEHNASVCMLPCGLLITAPAQRALGTVLLIIKQTSSEARLAHPRPSTGTLRTEYGVISWSWASRYTAARS